MSEAKVEGAEVKPARKPTKFTALKNLCNSKGQVKKGDKFTCTADEAAKFKQAKAI